MKFIKIKETRPLIIKPAPWKFIYEKYSLKFLLKQKSLFFYYVKSFVKKGKKLKFFNTLSSIFFDLYGIFKKNLSNYKYAFEVLTYQLVFTENFNINLLINWYTQHFFFFFFSKFLKTAESKK